MINLPTDLDKFLEDAKKKRSAIEVLEGMAVFTVRSNAGKEALFKPVVEEVGLDAATEIWSRWEQGIRPLMGPLPVENSPADEASNVVPISAGRRKRSRKSGNGEQNRSDAAASATEDPPMG
jgi:hypothetical protein